MSTKINFSKRNIEIFLLLCQKDSTYVNALAKVRTLKIHMVDFCLWHVVGPKSVGE